MSDVGLGEYAKSAFISTLGVSVFGCRSVALPCTIYPHPPATIRAHRVRLWLTGPEAALAELGDEEDGADREATIPPTTSAETPWYPR